jgi:hypothetical protein
VPPASEPVVIAAAQAVSPSPAASERAAVKAPAEVGQAGSLLPGSSAGDAGADAATIDGRGADAKAATETAAAPPAERPPCPEDMAQIGQKLCVDRYEAHLVAEIAGVLTPHEHFKRPEPSVRYLAKSAPGVFPQGYISRVEAKAACEASGKRLCSRREWMRACQAKGSETYPYGANGQRGRCNTGKIHLLTEMFGHKPKGGLKYDDHFNSPELNQTPGFLARSGEYPGCVSEREVFDMVGNLHEWVSDMVTSDLLYELEEEGVERREQPWTEGNGVFMGGFYSTTNELGPGCYYTTVAHEPRYHDYSTGFRCCASARPSSVVPASAKEKSGRR